MLPRADRPGITNAEWNLTHECAHGIGHDSACLPIATADDIACTHRSNGYSVAAVFLGIKEGIAIGSHHQLRASFAVAVGVVSSQRIGFPVRPRPLMVEIALVAGNDDRGLHAAGPAHSLE